MRTILRQIIAVISLAAIGVFQGAAAQVPTITQRAEAPAQGSTDKAVKAELKQSLVVVVDGKEELKDASSVKPGDLIEYRVTYTNLTGKAVTGFVATLPIPRELEYQPFTAKPGAPLAQAATANGRFDKEPLLKPVPGKPAQPVPYLEYRTLRWNLSQLPAGGVTEVTARARVLVTPAPITEQSAAQAPPAK